MPKVPITQNSFTAGILSPLLKGRVDLAQYQNGLDKGDDIFLIPQGGFKRRPGTEHRFVSPNPPERIVTLPTMPNGGSAVNINDGLDASGTITTVGIGTTSPYVVAHYDLGAPTLITYSDIRLMTLSVGSSAEFVVEYSTDNVSWSVAFNVPTVDTSSAVNIRGLVGQTARYFRLARVGGIDLGASQVILSEFNLWQPGTYSDAIKIKGFRVIDGLSFLFVFLPGHLSIYDSLGFEAFAFKTNYKDFELQQLRFAQSENVIIVVHPNHPPQRLIYFEAGGVPFQDAKWTLDDVPFVAVPQFDFNDNLSPTPVDEIQRLTFVGASDNLNYQWDLNGVLSKSVVYSSTDDNANAANIQQNLLDMPVTGSTGVNVTVFAPASYEITFSGESADNYQEIIAYPITVGTGTIATTQVQDGSPRKEPIWSDTRGYPGSVAFFEGRLWFGGTRSKPQSLFGSKPGSFFDFDVGEGAADDAIFVTLATRSLNEIVDLFPGRNLQVFTVNGEFVLPQSPATPATVGLSLQTGYGAKKVEPVDIDGATLFIDRNGKTVRRFYFTDAENAYISDDVSVLTPELINNPIDIEVVIGTQSQDANWMFVLNEAGDMAVLNTLRAQGVNGFTRWSTEDKIIDMTAINNDLWMVNQRTIDGSPQNHVEQWSFDAFMDDVTNTVVGGLATDTFTGLDYLEGKTVSVLAEGVVFKDLVVSGGEVTLPREVSNTDVQIGINFVPTAQPMPMAPNFGAGSRQMRKKKMVRHNLRLLDTVSLYVDGIPQAVRQLLPAGMGSPLDTPPTPLTGVLADIEGQQGWDRDQAPLLTQPDPFNMTVLSIETETETS